MLHTVLTERSVSRAAIKLGMFQPAVSAALKRLRALSGDPLLVRSGATMVPTDVALRMIEPAASILRAAEAMFSGSRAFDPQTATDTFRIAASDFLDPLFLPMLMAELKAKAPLCRVEIHPLSADSNYHGHLAQGDFDLVIGNWQEPPGDLHMARLFDDEIVSLVSADHPAVRRGWDAAAWLAAEHIAPMPTHPGARGIIDQMLDTLGLERNIAARCAHFGLIPDMVAATRLVLTTGRQYCGRFNDRLPVKILPCPIEMPRLVYYQLWHERTHTSNAARWLRDRTKAVASTLR